MSRGTETTLVGKGGFNIVHRDGQKIIKTPLDNKPDHKKPYIKAMSAPPRAVRIAKKAYPHLSIGLKGTKSWFMPFFERNTSVKDDEAIARETLRNFIIDRRIYVDACRLDNSKKDDQGAIVFVDYDLGLRLRRGSIASDAYWKIMKGEFEEFWSFFEDKSHSDAFVPLTVTMIRNLILLQNNLEDKLIKNEYLEYNIIMSLKVARGSKFNKDFLEALVVLNQSSPALLTPLNCKTLLDNNNLQEIIIWIKQNPALSTTSNCHALLNDKNLQIAIIWMMKNKRELLTTSNCQALFDNKNLQRAIIWIKENRSILLTNENHPALFEIIKSITQNIPELLPSEYLPVLPNVMKWIKQPHLLTFKWFQALLNTEKLTTILQDEKSEGQAIIAIKKLLAEKFYNAPPLLDEIKDDKETVISRCLYRMAHKMNKLEQELLNNLSRHSFFSLSSRELRVKKNKIEGLHELIRKIFQAMSSQDSQPNLVKIVDETIKDHPDLISGIFSHETKTEICDMLKYYDANHYYVSQNLMLGCYRSD